MGSSLYFKITGTLFLLIGLLHLLRIFYGWEAVIGGVAIPSWASWTALAFAGLLSYSGLRLISRGE